MKRNSRLALALHTLGHMAADPMRLHSSAAIAAHAGTNPVVVRRVLGKLRAAGLLVSEKGHKGGWRLSRAPGEISLADVYLALEDPHQAPDPAEEPSTCAVEHALHHQVSGIFAEVESSLIERLSAVTIQSVAEGKAL